MCLRQFEQLHGNMRKIARNIKHVSTLSCVFVCVHSYECNGKTRAPQLENRGRFDSHQHTQNRATAQ